MTALPPASKSAVPRPHRRTGWTKRLARFRASGVVAAVLIGACGGSGSNDATSNGAAAPTMTTTAPTGLTAAPTMPIRAAAAGVTVKQFQFMPAELVVKAGTTVTWTNQDQILHTATSGAMPGRADGHFDGPMDGPGNSFSFTFDEPGTYPYFCSRHNSMVGKITVR
jgi:plastocyanin